MLCISWTKPTSINSYQVSKNIVISVNVYKEFSHFLKGTAQCILQREVFCLQGRVVALKLLQTGVHDVQDGALDGPHHWSQMHMQLYHIRLVPVQYTVH